MKKNLRQSLVACIALVVMQNLQAQSLNYPEFTVPVYRYALDQRYSEHKNIFYTADIDESLGNTLFPGKSRKFNVDSFRLSIAGELVNSGIDFRVTNTDLSVVITVEKFNATPQGETSMMGNTNYSVEGKATLYVMNKMNERYLAKPIDLSEIAQLQSNELVKNNFTKDLANSKAIEKYSLLVRAIKRIAHQCEDTYANGFKKKTIQLTSVARAEKKYPELTFFDNINSQIVAELNKKTITDYKEFILPYEKQITEFIGKEFPKGYDMKDIKLAGNYTLAFLYYLAYDTVKFRQTLDFLYENSNKVFGNRIQYNDRKPLMGDMQLYYTNLNAEKISPATSTGVVQTMDNGAGVEKVMEGWLLLEKGDTVKGKVVIQHHAGTMIDLDGKNKVLFEYQNEKGRTARKSFKYNEIRMMSLNNKVYENHSFKPTMSQSQEASLDLLRSRDYLLEVIYAGNKIKIFKDTYGETPSNAILFIRNGEKELANQGKDWNRNKQNMMKEYFKDCTNVLTRLGNNGYDFKTEKGYLDLAKDYEGSCN